MFLASMGHVGLHETIDSNEMKIFRIFDFTETKRNLRFTKNFTFEKFTTIQYCPTHVNFANKICKNF